MKDQSKDDSVKKEKKQGWNKILFLPCFLFLWQPYNGMCI